MEVDKDLTMIQPDPTPSEKSFAELMKTAPRIGSLSSATTADQAMKEYNTRELVDNSIQLGSGDSLDQGRAIGESTNDVRARNQSPWIKGAKAVGGGVAVGSAIIMEQLGYLADWDSYTNLFKEVKDNSGNAWSNAFRDAQTNMQESDMFKIYEKDPDKNSVLSQIFKWSSLQGVVSSAVGFGVTGLGAASIVSKLGSLKQFGKLAAMADGVFGAPGISASIVGPLASSTLANFYMGQLMAVDTYSQSMEGLAGAIEAGEVTPLEAQTIASQNAQDVVELNMLLVGTSYLTFGNIFKRQGKLKSLVESPTALNITKQMIKRGSPTEFTEEVYQEMLQMEQIHDTMTESGQESEFSNNYWDRMSEMALSNRVLTAGALGVAGGPMQFAIIQRPMMGKQLQAQREARDKQDISMRYHEELKKNNYATFNEYAELQAKAAVNGDMVAAKLAGDFQLINEIVKSGENGTLGYLKRDMENLMKSEEAPEGFDADYKETAANAIATIDQVEKMLVKYADAPNKSEIINNDLLYNRVADEVASVRAQRTEAAAAVQADFKKIHGFDIESNLKIKREKERFDGLTNEDKAKAIVREAKEDSTLANFLASNPHYETYLDLKEKAKKLSDLHKDLSEKRVLYTSKEHQIKYAIDQREATTKEALKAKIENAKKNEPVSTETDERISFSRVKADAPVETPEVKAAREAEWSQFKGTSVVKDNTFTSKDKHGVTRPYTPGDLLRAVDGRYFRVLGQNYAAESKGTLTAPTMPLIKEANKDGSFKKGAKAVELGEHSFLRPEVRQGTTLADKRVIYPKETDWGAYVEVDSPLKPSNAVSMASKHDRAEKNQAITVNNHQFVTNNPKKGEGLTPTQKYLDYPGMNEFNKPLYEDSSYEVELRANDKGQGQKFVDVVKKTANGEVLMAPLDRHSNLNHDAILQALTKGPVFGKVVAHYSSSSNISTLTDEEGKKIYNSLDKLTGMPKGYLPDGKVIIAQSVGSSEYVTEGMRDAALDMDGKTYEDTITFTDNDGVSRTLAIPYEHMKVGDTYVLIVSPQGMLMPVATSSRKISEIDGMTSRAIEIIEQTTKDIVTELIGNEDEYDIEQKGLLAATNQSYADQTKQFIKDKNSFIFNNRKEKVRAKFKESIYKMIRPNLSPFSRVQTSDKSVKVLVRDHKGNPANNPNYFEVSISTDKNGKFSPTLLVYDPSKPYKMKDSGAWKKINLSDNPAEFMAVLGERYKRNSIIDLINPTPEATKAMMTGDITTDINISQPFAGSSATIELQGDDIPQLAADRLKEFGDKFGQKFKTAKVDTSEVAIKRAVSSIDVMLKADPESTEGNNLFHISLVETPQALASAAVGLLSSLDMDPADFRKYSKELNEALDGKKIDLITEEDVTAYKELLEDTTIKSNVEGVAIVGAFLNALSNTIENGAVKFISKSRANESNNPNHIQPDGYIFKRNDNVFSTVYGKATVVSSSSDNSRYKIRTNKGVDHTVFASDLYLYDSPRRRLFEINVALSKVPSSNPEYARYLRKIAQLEDQLVKPGDTSAKEYEGATEFPGEAPDSNFNLIEFLKTITVPDNRLELFSKVSPTRRGLEMTSAMASLSGLNDIAVQRRKEEGPTTPASDDFIRRARTQMLDAIPYTEEQLDDLIKLAETKKFTDPKQGDYVHYFEGMKTIMKALSSSDLDSETLVQVPYINKKGLVDKNDVYIPGRQMNDPFQVGRSSKKLTMTNSLMSSHATVGLPVHLGKVFYAELDLNLTKYLSEPAPAPVNVGRMEKKPIAVANKPEVKGMQANQAEDDLEAELSGTEEDTPTLITEVKSTPIKTPGQILNDTLTPEQKEKVDALDARGRSRFTAAYEALVSKNLPTDSVIKRYFGTDFRLGDEITLTDAQFKMEVAEAKAMLPQVPIEVVENVTAMVNRFGVKAIGAFDNGTRVLVRNGKEGTAAHETFHAVAKLFLRPFEKVEIAKENGYQKWNKDLEEFLADKFAKFVQEKREMSLGARTKRFFKGIVDWAKGTRSQDATTKLFEKIVSKGYAGDLSINYLSNVANNELARKSLESFKNQLTQKELVTLQQLVDNNKIKIVC